MAPPSEVELLPYWYVACLSREVGRRPVARTVGGMPVVLFRDSAGRVSALVDRCPHRNVPLSAGRVRGDRLQCGYHGWEFGGDGTCLAVPGLVDDGPARRARRAAPVPVAEADGFVWVWPGPGEPERAPFRFPLVDAPAYRTVRHAATVEASLHAALENTLDVPHTAHLHRGLFRGGRDPVDVEVVVRTRPDGIEAEYVGEPRPEGIAGRVLAPGGGVVTHVDRFLLPSIAQVEYALGPNHLVTTTAFTPVDGGTVRLHAAVTFRLRVPPDLVRPLVTPLARVILAQDARMLRAQSANVARFGGEQFASTELDVMGQHLLRLLRRAARGEPLHPAEERRVRMRI